MLLLDGNTVLAEGWDYRLRASIESGETDLKTSNITEMLYENWRWHQAQQAS